MTRPTIGFGLSLAILTLSSCGIMIGHTGAARRVTAEQLSKIHLGMTIEQAWDALGRPWQIVVDGIADPREVHRYRMNGEDYVETVQTYDVEEDEHVTQNVTLTQLRIVELTFDSGKLVKGRR